MTERITNSMVINTTLTDINAAQLAMDRTEDELSSGKSILEPSDNPVGASRAIELQSTLDGLTSYEHSAEDGNSWLNTASSALSNVDELVQRVHELTLQAASGIENQTDLNAIAGEVEQITEAIKQDANTQYAGQYVFSGTLTETAPYHQGAEDAYQGNGEAIARAIAPGSSVNISVNINSVLGGGGGDGKLLSTLRTIAQNLRTGTPAAMEELAGANSKSLGANTEALEGLQAEAGSKTDQMRTAISRVQDLQTTATEQLSNVQDANIAQVSMEFSNQQAAYDAALRAGASIVQESLLEFLQ
jgi:flagellar hook-associated protein 3 FlgL